MARTPKKAAVSDGMPYTFVARTPIQHDLVDYEVGDEIVLTEAAAEPLLAVGAIELVGEAAEAQPTE